jgi:hypothetical protein
VEPGKAKSAKSEARNNIKIGMSNMTKGFIILYFYHFEFVSDFGIEIFSKNKNPDLHHCFLPARKQRSKTSNKDLNQTLCLS